MTNCLFAHIIVVKCEVNFKGIFMAENFIEKKDFSQSQISKLSEILNDFYCITGIKICVFDATGSEIAYAPQIHCNFCKYVHKSQKGAALCDKCLQDAFDICRETKQTYIYYCHMGLVECVSPIFQLNTLIGFIMIGQIVNKDSSLTSDFMDSVKSKLNNCNLDATNAEELIKSVPVSTFEKIKSSVSILETCASYIYLNKLLSEQSSFITEINSYIRKNIENNITVEDMCKALGVSLMELYYMCNAFFGSTPAKHVKKIRLETACELITDENVRISEIAYRVGICDYNYFSKIFKKEYGVSPTEYKKQNKATSR